MGDLPRSYDMCIDVVRPGDKVIFPTRIEQVAETRMGRYGKVVITYVSGRTRSYSPDTRLRILNPKA